MVAVRAMKMAPWVVVELLFEAEASELVAVLEFALVEVAAAAPVRIPVADVAA